MKACMLLQKAKRVMSDECKQPKNQKSKQANNQIKVQSSRQAGTIVRVGKDSTSSSVQCVEEVQERGRCDLSSQCGLCCVLCVRVFKVQHFDVPNKKK